MVYGKSIKERKKDYHILKWLENAEIKAYTYVYPCEDINKVIKALTNVVHGKIFSENVDPQGNIKKLYIISRGKEAILRIFNQFRSRRVLAALRKHLLKYYKEDMILLYLHKQAAYVNVYSLCDVGESPLGEIVVEIKVENPKDTIYYLTRF